MTSGQAVLEPFLLPQESILLPAQRARYVGTIFPAPRALSNSHAAASSSMCSSAHRSRSGTPLLLVLFPSGDQWCTWLRGAWMMFCDRSTYHYAHGRCIPRSGISVGPCETHPFSCRSYDVVSRIVRPRGHILFSKRFV